ncbi:MAG: M20/M25/M40 family metallo-hydrolase, partial [Myxococcales bacterium]|nr:M20/M25/M40 family metallo-hydrolase [Myxococcales bacterium]
AGGSSWRGVAQAALALGAASLGCGSERSATPTAPTTLATSASALAPAPSGSGSAARGAAGARAFSAEAILAHVRRLAGPELAGRKAGSAGEAQARAYVAAELDRAGIAAPPSGRSFELAPVGGWEVVPGTSGNVYGLVRGRRKDAYVVLGAHLDHLGLVDGVLYPGAEDNASGVAVVLEVGRALQAHAAELEQSVVVALFGAEEIGMLGSQAYVREPPVPLAETTVMVNVDMIGRPLADQAGVSFALVPFGIDPDEAVGVIGTEGRPALRAVVDEACRGAGIRPVAPEDFPAFIRDALNRVAKGRGDNASFERVGIPSVFFSSGESDDYHEPTDTPDRLDGAILAARAEAIYRAVVGLGARDPAPPARE